MRLFSSTWLMAQQNLESIAQDQSVNPIAKHFGMILLRRMGEFQLPLRAAGSKHLHGEVGSKK
jgi:hypothetical protein